MQASSHGENTRLAITASTRVFINVLCAAAMCGLALAFEPVALAGEVLPPAQAEEVLYCADTAAAGFKWSQRGEASLTAFQPRRFTIKVFPGKAFPYNITTMREGMHFRYFTEKRIVTGGWLSSPMEMECESSIGAALICEADGAFPWAFSHNNTYTRAFLAGPPAGERNDPNILIAYGTCTKF